MAKALLEVTHWRREKDIVVLIGPTTTFRFRSQRIERYLAALSNWRAGAAYQMGNCPRIALQLAGNRPALLRSLWPIACLQKAADNNGESDHATS